MERKVKIKTDTTHHLNGILNLPAKKTDRLVIFVHGLTGSSNRHLFYSAAREFPKQGVATFRFDLYPSPEKGSRSLRESTLTTHLSDLRSVVSYWQKKYKKIYVVGHSLGGLLILLAEDLPVEAAVLWDPSCNMEGRGISGVSDAAVYWKSIDCYVINWGTEVLVGKEMYQDWKKVPMPKELMKEYRTPVKIISAGKDMLVPACRAYYKYAHEPKSLVVIKNATHGFDEEETQEKLYAETLSWIKKF